jgi:hypothetical protein
MKTDYAQTVAVSSNAGSRPFLSLVLDESHPAGRALMIGTRSIGIGLHLLIQNDRSSLQTHLNLINASERASKSTRWGILSFAHPSRHGGQHAVGFAGTPVE